MSRRSLQCAGAGHRHCPGDYSTLQGGPEGTNNALRTVKCECDCHKRETR